MNRLKLLLPGAYHRLKELGTLHPINGICFYPPNNKVYKYTYLDLPHYNGEPSSYTIKRTQFDQILFEELKKQEFATVLNPYKALTVESTDNGAVVTTDKGTVSCEFVVVASGCKSAFAQGLTGNKVEDYHCALGVRAYFENVATDDKNYAEFYLDKTIYFGAFYIAPMANNLYNVNMVMTAGSVKEKGVNLRQHFLELIETHPVLNKKFKDAKIKGKVDGHPLLLGTKNRKLSGNRCLFIGDAGGLIDVVSANGIPQGMKSAEIAIGCIHKWREEKAIINDELMRQYDVLIYKKLKKDLLAGRIITQLNRVKFLRRIYLMATNLFVNRLLINLFMKIAVYTQNPLSFLMFRIL